MVPFELKSSVLQQDDQIGSSHCLMNVTKLLGLCMSCAHLRADG